LAQRSILICLGPQNSAARIQPDWESWKALELTTGPEMGWPFAMHSRSATNSDKITIVVRYSVNTYNGFMNLK